MSMCKMLRILVALIAIAGVSSLLSSCVTPSNTDERGYGGTGGHGGGHGGGVGGGSGR
ncbi:hypothetical protein [Legionella fallonii]|uniref:Lipoprotein n=1 Tax=Legionella fallonii LLAP-10 TaxID=1212491 RepID=A0A098G2B3_9GAMM|nr:hypothetical protein [Legionella fallonii]CEG56126.1 conserved exported protein of unknown function [Legionella fallonii LLAP-10]